MAAKELIQTITVGSGGTSSIVFSSIPQIGTDLYLVLSARNGTNFWPYPSFYFNADSTLTNYSVRYLIGSGTAASSETNTHSNIGLVGAKSTSTANTFGSSTAHIPNYASTYTKVWSVDGVNENNASDADAMILAGKWTGSAAITSLTLVPASGSFGQYTSASLYMFTKGSGGATVS